MVTSRYHAIRTYFTLIHSLAAQATQRRYQTFLSFFCYCGKSELGGYRQIFSSPSSLTVGSSLPSSLYLLLCSDSSWILYWFLWLWLTFTSIVLSWRPRLGSVCKDPVLISPFVQVPTERWLEFVPLLWWAGLL
jgi:hypothetical protein